MCFIFQRKLLYPWERAEYVNGAEGEGVDRKKQPNSFIELTMWGFDLFTLLIDQLKHFCIKIALSLPEEHL